MKLSVILPARNEEELIEMTLMSIFKYLSKKKYVFEILVVVNGSTDSTGDKVKKLSEGHPKIKYLKSQSGYGFASRKGLKEAEGEYVIIFNVDFYDFRLIDLVESDMEGKDIIIGSKLARGSKDERPLLRRMVSILFNYYLKIMYGFKGTDTHGIKLIKRKVVKTVLPLCRTKTGIFDTEFILKAQREGFTTEDIPIEVKELRPPRFAGRFLQTPIDIYFLHKSLKE